MDDEKYGPPFALPPWDAMIARVIEREVAGLKATYDSFQHQLDAVDAIMSARMEEFVYGDAIAREKDARQREKHPPITPRLTKRQRARQAQRTPMTVRYAPGLLERGL